MRKRKSHRFYWFLVFYCAINNKQILRREINFIGSVPFFPELKVTFSDASKISKLGLGGPMVLEKWGPCYKMGGSMIFVSYHFVKSRIN